MVFSVTQQVAIRNLYGEESPLVPFQSTWLVGVCAAVPPGVWTLRAGGQEVLLGAAEQNCQLHLHIGSPAHVPS